MSRPAQVDVAALKDMQTIYPQYLDSRLSRKDGRRLTKEQAVSLPTMSEIQVALRELGYTNIVACQNKSYPRTQGSDAFALVPRGCIKVAIKEPASQHYVKKSEFDTKERGVVVDGIESKHQVLVKVAALIKERWPQRPQPPAVAEIVASIVPNQPKGKK